MVWLVGVLFLAAVASTYFFPRPMIALLTVLVLFVGGVLIYAVYDMNATRTVRKNFSAKVFFDQARCTDPSKPVGVEFDNQTANTVTFAVYTLEAFRPGHSRSVLFLPSLTSDRIISAGAKWTTCLKLPSQPPGDGKLADLRWEANVTSLTFQR